MALTKAQFPWRRAHPATLPITLGFTSSVTATTFNLNSAMASGAGWGFTFIPVEDGNLTDVWIAPATFTGTWASTDKTLNGEVRLGLTATNRPGATVVGSPFTIGPFETFAGGSWIKASGLSIPVTQGVMYAMIFGDADGGATNYCAVNHTIAGGSSTAMISAPMTTTNGWAAGSSVANAPCVLFKIAGKMYGGGVHGGTLIAFASSTRRRGNRITVSQPMAFVGFAQTASVFQGNSAGPWHAEIWIDDTGPTGIPPWYYTFPTGANVATPVPTMYTVPLTSQYLLMPGHTYRVVVRPTANSTAPSMMPTFGVEPGDETDIPSLFAPDGMTCYATEEVGGAIWQDYPQRVTNLGIVLAPPRLAVIRG